MTRTKILLLAMFVTISIFALASADDSEGMAVTEDGAVYELIEGGGDYYAEIVAYDGYSQSVIVKASVNYDGVDYPVISIAENSFNIVPYYSEEQPGTSDEDKAKRDNITAITIEGNEELQFPSGTFEGLNNLVSIDIGDGITSIPEMFLYNCKKLSHVGLPSTLTTIGRYAFEYTGSLREIALNDGLVSIEYSAFAASGLTNISIPDSVKGLESNVFWNCSSLSEISLGDGLEYIKSGALKGTVLTSILFPSKVAAIDGKETFPITLESITVSEDNSVYYSMDGVMYTKADKHIFLYPTSRIGDLTLDYDVPSSLMASNINITKLILLDGVSSIGTNAFQGCTGLKEVVMTDSVTNIGNMAFFGCTSLEDLILSKSVTQIPLSCFRDCSSLESIDLSNVTSIGRFAFSGCTSLVLDSLPDSLVSIAGSAFSGCAGVNIERIPAGVTSILSNTFNGSGIERITVGDAEGVVTLNGGGFSIFGGAALLSVTLDNVNVGSIRPADVVDFAISPNLEEISFGPRFTDASFISSMTGAIAAAYPDKYVSPVVEDGVTTLKLEEKLGAVITMEGVKYTLTSMDPAKCSVTGYEGKITSLSIPETIDFYGSEAQVVSIGAKAFYGCDTLVSADLGSVTSVGVKAFAHCVKLETLDGGDSLKTISAYAFYRCLKLSDVDLGDSAKTLRTYGSYSFYKCGKLSSMIVPSFMTTIGTKAFTMPFADESGVALEASLDSLKGYEYSNVDGVLVRQHAPAVGSEFTSGKLVYSVTSSYPAEAGIVGYTGTLRALVVPETVAYDGFDCAVTSIFDEAFLKCRTLTTANLGNVEVIGGKAFYGCNKLTSVEADGLVTVGIKAFAYCVALSSLDLGDSLKTICAYGFYRCESLTSFDAPDSLVTIGSYAFYKCSALMTVHTGSSLATIGSKAFVLTDLTEIDFPATLKTVKSDAFDGYRFMDKDANYIDPTVDNLAGHLFRGVESLLRTYT
jgi:hypothetical protein